jgi:hypothetical protein
MKIAIAAAIALGLALALVMLPMAEGGSRNGRVAPSPS